MKKIFLSMMALATMVGAATAQKVVATVDFTKMSEMPWEPDGYTAALQDGYMQVTGSGWYQFPIAQSVELSAETTYTLTVGMRGAADGNGNIAIGNWGGDGWIDSGITINFTTEWDKCSATFTTNTAAAPFNIMFQPGSFPEYMDFAWVVVSEGDAAPESTPDFPKENVGPVDPSGKVIVVDAEYNFANYSSYDLCDWCDQPKIENGILTFSDPSKWCQFMVMNNLTFEEGVNYSVMAKIKGSKDGNLNVQLGNWGAMLNSDLNFTSEWSEVTVAMGEIPAADDGVVPSNGFSMFQIGTWDGPGYPGTLEIEWVKLIHYEEGAAPVEKEWTSIITNGDANNGESDNCIARIGGEDVTAPVVMNPAGAGMVFTCPIVAHPADSETITDWSSQFFIAFNEAVPEGTRLKVTFDYYSSNERTIQTQAHGEPGSYHHYVFLGDLKAKDAWQSFSKEVTVTADMVSGDGCECVGCKAIAFNLSTAVDAGTFYINNITVEKEVEAGVETVTSVKVVVPGVYNLNGVKVAESIDAVSIPGLYITNGKKVIKK